ncbi:MAG: MBL fold metallo-hydrolase [Bryobacterales bacterium]|nr:MBL fold metallo-hydrolase [Bryobacterales bacterium]
MRNAKLFLLIAIFGSLPGFAQIDPTGEWAPQFDEDFLERIPGPDIGDYLGLPINNAARLRGDSWDASLLTLPENQCRPHPSDYAWRGPANLRIWKEVDRDTQKLIAYHTHISWQAPERTIWMDGRPHPSADAAHTWQGFSTGTWDGDVLTITTTHLKEGWIRRNGIPRSENATITEHLFRHGDRLTVMVIIDDPAYLTEPFVRTTDFAYDARQQIAPYPCESVVEIPRPRGTVPNHLPGDNMFLTEFATRFHLPFAATRGGAATMYPEYRLTMNAGTADPNAIIAATDAGPAVEQNAIRPAGVNDGEVHVQHVQGNVYMLSGAGGNITVQIGKEGILLVDTGLTNMSDKVVAAVRKLSDGPIRYIVNTHVHPDHTGGNEKIAGLGSTIVGGNVTGDIADAGKGASVIAHQTILDRLSAKDLNQPAAPSGAWPTDTFSDEKDLYFNDEGIQVIHQPAAHTDGDSFVFFRRSDVVSAGDIFVTTGYPIIDLARGGSIQEIVDALNRLIALTIPAGKQEGGTMVIPGHGRLCDQADVVFYQEMVTILRDRIQAMIKQGMTLEQVKAARPTRDYDPVYGSTTGFWTTDMFVEAAYKSLGGKK